MILEVLINDRKSKKKQDQRNKLIRESKMGVKVNKLKLH